MEQGSIVRLTNLLNFTRQDYDVLGQRLMILILEKLKERQSFNIENKLEAIELSFNLHNFEQTDNTRLRALAKSVMRKQISFQNGDTWIEMIPIPYAKYENGVFTIQILGAVKSLFLELAKGYTNIEKKAVFTLSSQYSIRMYELLSAFSSKKQWTVSMVELRNFLSIENKYKDFATFKRYILEYCQSQLAEHCNLYFTWEIAQKQRKKITALTFHIQTIEQAQKVELKEEIRQTIDFVAKLTPIEIARTYNIITSKYNLSTKQADYIFADKKLLNEFIRVDLIIEDMITKGKPPQDRTKYLAKSLGLDKVKF